MGEAIGAHLIGWKMAATGAHLIGRKMGSSPTLWITRGSTSRLYCSKRKLPSCQSCRLEMGAHHDDSAETLEWVHAAR